MDVRPEDRCEAVPVGAAIVQLPEWLWGGRPMEYFRAAELHARKAPGPSPHVIVQTNERYFRRSPALLEQETIAGPTIRFPTFETLSTSEQVQFGGRTSAAISAARARRVSRLKNGGGLLEFLSLAMLDLQTVPQSDLPTIAETVYSELTAFSTDDSIERVFQNASLHAVRRNSVLSHRMKLASVLLRLEYDDSLAQGDVSTLNQENASGRTVFAASEDLYTGMYTLDAYVMPLLGALTPFVWAVAVYRQSGPVLLTLGRPVVGNLGDPAELMQLIGGHGATTSVTAPELSSTASTSAVGWWIDRLNGMLAVLSDPSVFTSPSGHYLPAAQHQALLTFEQLFRRIHSLQTSDRDTNARRVLLFSVLDTLERITGRAVEKACDVKFAQQTLDRLSSSMPVDAAQVLLPTAKRGIQSLDEVANGFFMQRGQSIVIRERGGKETLLSRAEAAAQYVKVLRDATHGHGSNKQSRIAITDALLANHDGRVPHDLGLLAFLYLLEVLDNPKVWALRLSAAARKKNA